MPVDCGPHTFRPLSFWDRFRRLGRCCHCYIPKHGHPVHTWMAARPVGDVQRMTWDEAIRLQFRVNVESEEASGG